MTGWKLYAIAEFPNSNDPLKKAELTYNSDLQLTDSLLFFKHPDATTWDTVKKRINEYNADGTLHTRGWIADGDTTEKTVMSYNDNGKIEQSLYYFNDSRYGLIKRDRKSFSYPDGVLTKIVKQRFDRSNSEWSDNGNTHFTYSKDQLVLASNGDPPQAKRVMTYNDDGNFASYARFRKKDDDWLKDTIKDSLIYNDSNQLERVNGYYPIDGTWELVSKQIFEYNEQGRVVRETIKTREKNDGSWTDWRNEHRLIFSYDSRGVMDKKTYQTYGYDGADGWVTTAEKHFTYKAGDIIVSTPDQPVENPSKVQLSSNYPNPFNPTTTIRYQIPATQELQLNVYNSLGQKVTTLVNKVQNAGEHSITFNAASYSSGVYIYQLVTEEKTFTRKMTLIK